MTLRTKSNRQSTVTFPCTEQLVAGRAKMLIPRLRRTAHSPGDFLADAIVVPVGDDVNLNLGAFADDFWGVTSDGNTPALGIVAGAAILAEPTVQGVARIAAALDDEDEEEDEDDSYDDDDLDEEDDEELDDEDDEGYEDDLDDDGELDDDLDDEDEDEEDE